MVKNIIKKIWLTFSLIFVIFVVASSVNIKAFGASSIIESKGQHTTAVSGKINEYLDITNDYNNAINVFYFQGNGVNSIFNNESNEIRLYVDGKIEISVEEALITSVTIATSRNDGVLINNNNHLITDKDIYWSSSGDDKISIQAAGSQVRIKNIIIKYSNLSSPKIIFFESSFDFYEGILEEDVNFSASAGLDENFLNLYILQNLATLPKIEDNKLILNSGTPRSEDGTTLNFRPSNDYLIDSLHINFSIENTAKTKVLIDNDVENAKTHLRPTTLQLNNLKAEHISIQNIHNSSSFYDLKELHITSFTIRLKRKENYFLNHWKKNSDGYEYLFYDYQEVFQNGQLLIEDENIQAYYFEWAPIVMETGDFTPDQEYYNVVDMKQGYIFRINYFFENEMIRYKLAMFNADKTTIWEFKTTYANEDFGYYGFSIRRRLKSVELPPEKPPENNDDIILTPLEELPRTKVQIDSSDLGRVYFYVDNNNVLVQISYNQEVYYLNYSFENVDMDLFDVLEAYYTNPDGNPSIFINHSQYPFLLDILSAPEDEKPAFVPHTIWDLKTNEIKTIDQYRTLVYLKQMEAGPIVAYMYIDEFIIDKILTMQVSWTSRQRNGWPLNWFGNEYTNWEQHTETYTGDDYLTYRNLYTDWQHLIPVWQFIKLAQQLIVEYEMPRINAVDWNNLQHEYNITKHELESYFHFLDDSFSALKTNPRYKVWAIALQGGKKSSTIFAQTEFYHNENNLSDPKNFHIMHLTYETNGVLYETVGDHMDLKVYVDDGLLPKQKSGLSYLRIIALLVGVIIIFAAFKAKAFSSPRKAIEFIIGTAIILAFVIIGYNLLKDGNFFEIGP